MIPLHCWRPSRNAWDFSALLEIFLHYWRFFALLKTFLHCWRFSTLLEIFPHCWRSSFSAGEFLAPLEIILHSWRFSRITEDCPASPEIILQCWRFSLVAGEYPTMLKLISHRWTVFGTPRLQTPRFERQGWPSFSIGRWRYRLRISFGDRFRLDAANCIRTKTALSSFEWRSFSSLADNSQQTMVNRQDYCCDEEDDDDEEQWFVIGAKGMKKMMMMKIYEESEDGEIKGSNNLNCSKLTIIGTSKQSRLLLIGRCCERF